MFSGVAIEQSNDNDAEGKGRDRGKVKRAPPTQPERSLSALALPTVPVTANYGANVVMFVQAKALAECFKTAPHWQHYDEPSPSAYSYQSAEFSQVIMENHNSQHTHQQAKDISPPYAQSVPNEHQTGEWKSVIAAQTIIQAMATTYLLWRNRSSRRQSTGSRWRIWAPI